MDSWRETVGAALSANVYFGAVASIFCYGIGVYLQKRYRFILFNPILIGIILVVVLLKVFRIDFKSYDEGASHLNYLLTPATVALAIPLYKQFEALKRNWKVTLASICVGVLTNCAAVYITAKLFDLERVYYVTCLTKSITTAIGMGVTEELGGDVTIAVVMIILSGICGAVFGEKTLKLFHVTDPRYRLARYWNVKSAGNRRDCRRVERARDCPYGRSDGYSCPILCRTDRLSRLQTPNKNAG